MRIESYAIWFSSIVYTEGFIECFFFKLRSRFFFNELDSKLKMLLGVTQIINSVRC